MKSYPNRIKHETFIGIEIGKVKVIAFDRFEEGDKRLVYYYKYQCSCGTIESAPKYSLLQSKKSRNTYCCTKCRKDKLVEWAKSSSIKYIDPIEGKCSTIHSNYRSRAKKKKLEFTLTFEEFKSMVTSNCHYCGLEPNKCRMDRTKSRQGLSRINFNGIDRVNNEMGYTIKNTVTCCEDCNKAKRNLSYNQFLDLIKRIYKNLYEFKTNDSNR